MQFADPAPGEGQGDRQFRQEIGFVDAEHFRHDPSCAGPGQIAYEIDPAGLAGPPEGPFDFKVGAAPHIPVELLVGCKGLPGSVEHGLDVGPIPAGFRTVFGGDWNRRAASRAIGSVAIVAHRKAEIATAVIGIVVQNGRYIGVFAEKHNIAPGAGRLDR